MRKLGFIFIVLSALNLQCHSPQDNDYILLDTRDLKIEKLSDNFYVYTTYNEYKGQRISANGMYVLTDEGAILIDTPWDSRQYQVLLDVIKSRHHQEVRMLIGTHWHEDRAGNFSFFQDKGIPTYATMMTNEFLKKNGKSVAHNIVASEQNITMGKESFEVFYPGPGHSMDNIVLWFPKEKILYGGCFIKSVEATDLGNTQDGDVKEWPNSIEKVKKKFGEPDYIIPGHGAWRDKNSLEHTLALIRKSNVPRPLHEKTHLNICISAYYLVYLG